MVRRFRAGCVLVTTLMLGAATVCTPAWAVDSVTSPIPGQVEVQWSSASLGYPRLFFCPSSFSNAGCATSNGAAATYSDRSFPSPTTYQVGSPVGLGNLGTTPTTLAAGTYRIVLQYNALGVTGDVFTIGSSGGTSSDSSTSTSTLPAPIVQQFTKPVTGTCVDAAPTSLNWSGVSSGGWGESWAQWPNGGNGGPVCTRTLTYSTSLSTWMTS